LVEADDPKLTAPTVLSQAQPRYPALAQERRIAGTVELSALVDEAGRVADLRVVRVAPPKLGFEEAAVQHARSRRYKPATKDGVAVRVWMPIVVNFVPKR
jgi:protein TonB